MFGLRKAYPYIDGQEIPDTRSDRKHAEKIEDTKFGKEALYFCRNATLYYLPYRCIKEVSSGVNTEHHSCCSGDNAMEVPTVTLRCGSSRLQLTFTNTDASRKAEQMIRSALSSVK